MRHILITGANRGIGLELVQRYLNADDTFIFATCRQPDQATELQALHKKYPERLRILAMDVTDQQSINVAVSDIQKQVDRLDMLVNNAGIYPSGVDGREAASSQFGALEAGAMLAIFRVNTVAPVMVTQACADLLRRGENARVVNMSSDTGSISRMAHSGNYSYPASKAALNMLTRCLAAELRADGVIVISVHPGWIQTDMGGSDAPRKPADTLPSMMRCIDELTLADSGIFLNWDGSIVPW